MNERNLEELLRNIQAMIRCPHCGSSYSKENIVIMGNMGESVLVQLTCISCKMPVMATIVAKGINLNDTFVNNLGNHSKDSGMLNSGHEKEITSDEIIDMHNFLVSFDGDFEKLFK